MKKSLMTLAAMAAMCGFAGQDDLLVTLTVNEQLAYKGGALVDNEYVALVWTPKATTFQGFYANLAPIDGQSKVLATVVVKDGRFAKTTFQISAAYAEELKLSQGSFALYLLDTRGADGKSVLEAIDPATGKNAGAVGVNYFVKVADVQTTGAAGAVSMTETAGAASDKIIAQGVAQLPLTEAELKPIIKSVKVEDGKFKVTVENAVPYMKYGLAIGSEPGKLAAPAAMMTPVTETVTLETSAAEPSKVMTVTAERNQ